MGIKLVCSVCEAYIRDVPLNRVSTITGKELCVICEEKIENIYGEIEKIKKDTVIKINLVWDKANDELKSVERFRESTLHKCNVLFEQKSAQVAQAMKDIVEGKKKKEEKSEKEEKKD